MSTRNTAFCNNEMHASRCLPDDVMRMDVSVGSVEHNGIALDRSIESGNDSFDGRSPEIVERSIVNCPTGMVRDGAVCGFQSDQSVSHSGCSIARLAVWPLQSV